MDNQSWAARVRSECTDFPLSDEQRKHIEERLEKNDHAKVHQILSEAIWSEQFWFEEDELCEEEQPEVDTATLVASLQEAIANDEIEEDELGVLREKCQELIHSYDGDVLLKAEAYQHLQEQAGKYWDLVWYARSDPRCSPDKPDDIRAGVFLGQTRIEATYPEEVESLSGEHSNWQHGFNSGMLACLRLILESLGGCFEQAKEEFPILDT